RGMEANRQACEAAVEKSLALVTSLNPYIGYQRAAAIAKEAFRTGKTVRQVCLEQNVLPPEQLEEALNPRNMLHPR
ncbi:MAG: aspartate ammonia-lyase, partial [Thermogutta sp.]|nr:aspartate ammonia-lyase [Thermogutta sp.]